MRRYLLSILALLILPILASAQTGLPPFGSLDPTGVDIRNNQDLNILLSLPVASSTGRGLNLSFSIIYNSSLWTNANAAWTPNANNALWGWTTSYSTGQTTYKSSSTQKLCQHLAGDDLYTYTTTYNSFQYIDPFGTPHQFSVYWKDVYSECTQSDTISGTFTGYASDGSGYYISLNSGDGSISSVLSRGGFNFTQPGTLIDTNGNYLSGSSPQAGEMDWTDSAGHLVLKIITGSSSIQYKVLDPTGAYQTTTLNLQSFSIKTNFACSGVTEYNGTASLPVSLVYPNNQTYAFTYEPTPQNSGYYTGRLQRITLPTSGYYEYDYPGANDSVNCSDGTTLSVNRVVSDGTNTATWNYARNASNLTTTITIPTLADTPNSNDMVVTFNSSGRETSRKIYANSPGTGTPLRTINTTWASNGTPATLVTILEDGSTQSEVDTTYDSNGLLDSISQHDFGSGALIRTTSFTYNTSTNYTSRNILDLVTSKKIQDSTGTVVYRQDTTYDGATLTNCPTGAAQHSDAAFPCTFNYRGNPTSVTTYLTPSGPSNGITKNFTYDWFGNLLTAQLNCCQTKTWSYSSTTQYSAPDSVTSGTSPTLTTTATYNAYTGQIATFTDENNLVTHFSYDSLRRTTAIWETIGSTNGASVSYNYNDVNSPFTVTTTAQIDSSNSLQQITAIDSLGRPNLTMTEDVNNNVYSKVSSQFDLGGRAFKTSNPYTGTASNWTTTQFDVLGRPTSVTLPDNSATTYSYTTNTTTVTDPTGKQRKSALDAAVRLVTLWEPDPSNNNSLILQTSYAYNLLDELTQVTQGSQSRSFVYDALGRLNSATTPEAGRVCFGTVSGSTCNSDGYDNFDNLLYRTDARGVRTTYGYDGLNRLSSTSYNVGTTGVPATATVSLTYGTNASQYNNGRLITMTDGVGSENYTYNNLGQTTQLQKVISGTTYTTGYVYNLASELTQITYPSGRSVQQSVDAIGRLSSIVGTLKSVNTTYASGFGYSMAQQLIGFSYGNGIYASFGFSSDRLQLTCLDYSTTNRNGNCTHDSTTKFGLNYTYGTAGSNNSQISSISDSVDNGRSSAYTYDSLYRLTRGTTTGSTNYPSWDLAMSYDRYGNRLSQSVPTGSSGCVYPMTCPTNSVSVSATTNQITGSPYAYDLNGNMTNDGYNTLVYNAENQLVNINSASNEYLYDGNGLRVKKCAPNCSSPTSRTVYIFSGSKVIAEYDNGAGVSSPSREYIYAGGALLARIDGSTTKYYHQDHLSNRLTTDSSGAASEQKGHFPFGEDWYQGSDKLKFTSYERDSESGNDYAMARYNVNRLGRFSSPDPLAGDIGNPQSLNRYAYTRNQPINLTDPFGLHAPGHCRDVVKIHKDIAIADEAGWGPSEESSVDSAEPEPQQSQNCDQDPGGAGGGPECFAFGDLSIPCGLLASESVDITGFSPGFPIGIRVEFPPNGREAYLTFALDWGLLSGRPDVDEAENLLMKDDCAKFLLKIATKAFSSLNPYSVDAAKNLVRQSASAANISNTLENAQYIDKQYLSKTLGGGSAVSAEADPVGGPKITLYQAYSLQSLTRKAQILIHESVHLVVPGLSDQALAQAATGKKYPDTLAGLVKASTALQAQIEKHCKE